MADSKCHHPIEFLFPEYANDRYIIQRDARSIGFFSWVGKLYKDTSHFFDFFIPKILDRWETLLRVLENVARFFLSRLLIVSKCEIIQFENNMLINEIFDASELFWQISNEYVQSVVSLWCVEQV